jgi:Mg2+ and Co2+ transporter CorA
MDIHPPAGAIHSFRDYLVHLSMVVIGILIALSLESGLEKHHAHQLATRAVRDMLGEIRANRVQIETSVPALERAQGELQRLLEAQRKAIEAQRHREPPPSEVPVQSNATAFPLLSSAAWDSALAMQAIGQINVDTAEALARIYSNQSEVKDLQKTFLAVAFHFETFAGRPASDTAERMVDRLGALQELSATLQNLLGGYRDLLKLYATTTQAGMEDQDVMAPAAASRPSVR